MERMTKEEYQKFKNMIKLSIRKNRTLILCGPPACGKSVTINEIVEKPEMNNLHFSQSLHFCKDFNVALGNIIKTLANYDCPVVFSLQNESLADELEKRKIINVIFMKKRIPNLWL